MTDQNDDRCLNCKAKLEGPFCSQCGQAKSARLVPIKSWMSDFSEMFLTLDFKLLRTLKLVLFQPGQATLDFAEGRRVPYCGPVRLYIIVSAISIAAMTIRGVFAADHNLLMPGVDMDPEFQERVQFLFPFVNLLSPFLSVFVLAIFQRKSYFQLHLAFSLHFWTFLIAISTPLIFIPPTIILALIAFVVLILVVIWYLILAHCRVYEVPTLHRIVVCGALLLSVPFASFVFTMLLFVIASLL